MAHLHLCSDAIRGEGIIESVTSRNVCSSQVDDLREELLILFEHLFLGAPSCGGSDCCAFHSHESEAVTCMRGRRLAHDTFAETRASHQTLDVSSSLMCTRWLLHFRNWTERSIKKISLKEQHVKRSTRVQHATPSTHEFVQSVTRSAAHVE